MKPLILIAAIATVASTQNASQALYINGKQAKLKLVTQENEPYVSVSDLKAAGAEVTMSENTVSIQFKPLREKLQVDAIEGIVGEFVQNDKFRIKVHSFEQSTNPFGRGPGYKVKVEIRNLSKTAAVFGTSGSPEIQLIDKNGNVLKPSSTSIKDQYTSLAPGNGFTNDIAFGDPANQLTSIGKPEKFLILFRVSGGVKLDDIRIFFPEKG